MVIGSLLELTPQHLDEFQLQRLAAQGFEAVLVDNFPLLVKYIVVVEKVLPHVKVVAFDLDLGAADGLGDDLVLHRGFFVQAGPTHNRLDAVTAEPLHQFIFQGDIELGTARVALASGAAS